MADLTLEAKARLKAQHDEYGQWVAIARIYHNGALAFTPGRPVPAGHVKKYGYDKSGLVKRRESSDAK